MFSSINFVKFNKHFDSREMNYHFLIDSHGAIMEKCWTFNAKDRQTFTNIVTLLDSYYNARYPCEYDISDTV